MNDKSWMLNAQALRHASQCVSIVKAELGIKLTLSNPEFMTLLTEYVELLDSAELASAYAQLVALAGGKPSAAPKATRKITRPTNNASPSAAAASNTVEYKGKSYPRYNDEGQEFNGLYRGQPAYR